MAELFGTDGVRGVANEYPMTAEMALNTRPPISLRRILKELMATERMILEPSAQYTKLTRSGGIGISSGKRHWQRMYIVTFVR